MPVLVFFITSCVLLAISLFAPLADSTQTKFLIGAVGVMIMAVVSIVLTFHSYNREIDADSKPSESRGRLFARLWIVSGGFVAILIAAWFGFEWYARQASGI